MKSAKFGLALLGAFALTMASSTSAEVYQSTVIATGLNNPRGLSFSPDGDLFIAESGYFVPGSPTTLSARGIPYSYSTTGSITRVSGGTQTRILTGLPSIGSTADVSGPNDIAFDAGGTGYVVLGLGLNPNVRSGDLASTGAYQLGQLYTFNPGGITPVANVSQYEADHNPVPVPLDSNPFHLASAPGGMLVTDAGGNDLLNVNGSLVSLLLTLPSAGPERVPTGIAVAPDGTYYLAELTGAPFIPGSANIYHLLPNGTVMGSFGGFTMLTDLAFGPDGNLYALEYDTNGLFNAGGTGALLRIHSDGSFDTLFTALTNPTGLTIGSDGAFYVTNFSGVAPTTTQGAGQVLRIAAAGVPEPATWVMMLLGFGGIGFVMRRSRNAALAYSS